MDSSTQIRSELVSSRSCSLEVSQSHNKKAPGHRSLLNAKSWIFLQRPHILGLQALRSLRHLEFHALPFLQAAGAAALDGGEMHKHILAALAADKTISLGVVKPLYCSLFHILVNYLSVNFYAGRSRKVLQGRYSLKKLVAAHNRFYANASHTVSEGALFRYKFQEKHALCGGFLVAPPSRGLFGGSPSAGSESFWVGCLPLLT